MQDRTPTGYYSVYLFADGTVAVMTASGAWQEPLVDPERAYELMSQSEDDGA